MKLSDFVAPQRTNARSAFERLNDVPRDYPSERTLPSIFAERAAQSPDAVAVVGGRASLSYGELERRANQMARFLLVHGLEPEQFVALMLDHSVDLVVAMLGVLKAGGAYQPINPSYPLERVRFLLDDSGAPVLVGNRTHIRELNKLQWECRSVQTTLCIDSEDVHSEIEPHGDLMQLEIWENIASTAFDDISAGGWKDSYTGEWLSREVMDGYGDNILGKLRSHIGPETRVLEVGCGSGITMFRLAPLVGHYCGTDISTGIADWADKEHRRRGLDNITIECLAAHEVDRVTESDFDVVIMNSVIECFAGHNYFRDVLRKSIARMGDQGIIFLGNVWDQDLKDEFVRSLQAYRDVNADNTHTKTDREDELFLSRGFFDDLRNDFPEIAKIEYSRMVGDARSEISDYRFDAFMRIDKTRAASAPPARHPAQRHRFQCDQRDLAAQSAVPLPVRGNGRSLAYLIYTSGSTGKPKGVMVEHRSILRLALGTNYVELGPGDRILQTGSPTFDASTFEIWAPLLTGSTTCLPVATQMADSQELRGLVERHDITTLFLTTALFNRAVESQIELFAGLRTVLTGGEKVSVRHFNRLRTTYPALRMLHVYGPTETTTFASWFEVNRIFETDVPIGVPLGHTSLFVLDKKLSLQPPGTRGELCIGGDGLARGYHAQPAATSAKFIPDPQGAGERLYRSGDLTCLSGAGQIEFLGRIDRQVKIRGFRVEPEEIERILLMHNTVERVAIVCLGEAEDRQLVAYVERSGDTLEGSDLHRFLKNRLPAFMVPAHILVLDELPLNTNGKVDRGALPDLDDTRLGERRESTPASDTERALAELWEELLGVPDIKPEDSFFELGGHSLKIPKLVALVQARFEIGIPYMLIYTADTLSELSRYIVDVQEMQKRGVDPRCAEQNLVLMSFGEGQHSARVFAFPPGSGFSIAYTEMSQRLQGVDFYGFTFLEDDTRLQEYAELIIGVDPDGPYALFGFSGGGKLAYQVAAHLEATGKQVAAVLLVDAARYLQPIPVNEADTRAVAQEFLDGISSAPLKEKAYRKMISYRTYLSQCVEQQVLDASIYLLLEENSPIEWRDDADRVIATVDGWRELTRGTFEMATGKGKHIHMLDPVNLEPNLKWFEETLVNLALVPRRVRP